MMGKLFLKLNQDNSKIKILLKQLGTEVKYILKKYILWLFIFPATPAKKQGLYM